MFCVNYFLKINSFSHTLYFGVPNPSDTKLRVPKNNQVKFCHGCYSNTLGIEMVKLFH